jgi:mRNA interferase RelE/StbE
MSNMTKKQLAKLDKPISKRIIQWLRDRIDGCENPRLWGEALVGEFTGLWKYRVGNFRLICDIRDEKLIVLVVELGNRKEVYK